MYSLFENPHDMTTRETYFMNFQEMFEQNKSVPIGILIEPLVTSNQMMDAYQFYTFDYDFFTFLSRHPKLTLRHSLALLDVLARQYMSDICNASIISVPFLMIQSRFMTLPECQEFMIKFVTLCLN